MTNIINIFPHLICEHVIEDFYYKNEMIEYFYNLKMNKNTIIHSNNGGWQSESNFFLSEEFQKFLDKIKEELKILVSPLKLKNPIGISNMWININPKGCYNDIHIHPHSFLSGVIYIKVPKNSGDLIFINQNTLHYPINDQFSSDFLEDYRIYDAFRIKPFEGLMLLFPYNLPHKVEKNNSNQDRISISFNIINYQN